MGETFATQTPDEGLEFRIYKELFATQYWNGNAVFKKMGKGFESAKKIDEWPISTWKDPQHH